MMIRFCCFGIFVLFAVSLVSAKIKVPALTSETFQDFISKKKFSIVYFHAKWCQFCSDFTPILKTLPDTFPDVPFGKVDAAAHRELSIKYVDDMLPGLALFAFGRFVENMPGDKTKKLVEEWIDQMTGPAVRWFDNLEEAHTHAEQFRVCFVAEVAPKEEKDFGFSVEQLLELHREWGKLIAVKSPEGTPPTLSIKHRDEDRVTYEYDGKIGGLEKFMEKNRFPLFGFMDTSNQREYQKTMKDPIILFGTEEHYKEHSDAFRVAAREHYDTHFFVWGLKPDDAEYSTMVLFSGNGKRRETRKYIFPAREFNDPNVIRKFIKDVNNGKVRPVIKSGEVLPEDEMAKAKVKPVNAEKFEEIVMHDDKDFMMVLTYPKGDANFEGCMKCPTVVEDLGILADLVAKKFDPSPIIFGSFDITENEFPVPGWGGTWEMPDLPVIYLLKAGEKVPLQFKGALDGVSLLKFWESQTENSNVRDNRISKIFKDEL